jgi:hypothetical protein
MVDAVWKLRVSLPKGVRRALRERNHGEALFSTARPARPMPTLNVDVERPSGLQVASYSTMPPFATPGGSRPADERTSAGDEAA